MKHELTVSVIGRAGSGKSAVAQIITEALQAAGYLHVDLVEDDHPPRDPARLDEIVNYMGDTTSIVVNTVQARRTDSRPERVENIAVYTTDPNDPDLNKSVVGQPNKVYLILSDEERAAGFVRPVHREYTHEKCGAVTIMGLELCETYARDPSFYGATYCCACKDHFPVGEFSWPDNTVVGS